MKVKTWFAAGAGVVLLLALGAGAALAAPNPAPTPSPVVSTVPRVNDIASDYAKYWRYTQADYSAVAAVLTPGYEKLSVAEFSRRLLDPGSEDAFHAAEDRVSRLLHSYPAGQPSAAAIDTAVRAAYEEATTRHYGGSCSRMAPTYWGEAEWVLSADVFGDKVPVFTAEVYYSVKYRIADEEKLTVGERDKVLAAYSQAVQTYLNGRTEQELKAEKTMEAALSKELSRLDKALSTPALTLTGRLDDYCADDFREWA